MDLFKQLLWLISKPQPNLHMGDKFRAPRESTVMELAAILDDERIVLVRGTPASGKSTLAYLLYEYYNKKNVATVLISSWPKSSEAKGFEFLLQQAHVWGYSDVTRGNIIDKNIVWILDEAQMSYEDAELWLGFIKFQHGRLSGPRICAFSSYGSPSAGPQEFGLGSPLVQLGIQQRVSITRSLIQGSPSISLFYSRNEFDDVLTRICNDYRCPMHLEADASDYIFSLTSGHPGAVVSILSMLKKVFRLALRRREIDAIHKAHILEVLDNEEHSFQHLAQTPIARSFVRGEVSPDAVAVLQDVLLNNSVEHDLERPGVRDCYQTGWLHSEALDMDGSKVVLVFPTRLHAKYVEHYYTNSSIPFPFAVFPTIQTLTESALRNFSQRQLSSNSHVLGTGALARPAETTYRDEFYRALHKVLGFSTRISSEWSGDASGRIDFRLPEVNWGIEILREGDRLREHCERFVNNGSYTSWIKDGRLTDWLIVDCRTSNPRPYDAPGTKLWRAVFSKDFSSVLVLGSSNQTIIPSFSLLS